MSDNGPKFFTITQLSETEEIQCFLARSLTTITQDVAPEQRSDLYWMASKGDERTNERRKEEANEASRERVCTEFH